MIRTALFGVLACLPILAFAQQPFQASEVRQTTAKVESIDQVSRSMILKDGAGVRSVIAAGPEVRNFEQIKEGDRIVASFRRAVAAEIKPKGQGVDGAKQTVTTVRAPEGARPAGAVGTSIATTVQIDSVDTSFDTVTFTRPDGITRTVGVESPDAKRFIRELKAGDEVQITYTEATALSLKPI